MKLIFLLLLCSSLHAQRIKEETSFNGDTTITKHLIATRVYYTLPPKYDEYVVVTIDTIIKHPRNNIFIITPVINEKCDTVIYHTHDETFTVYLLKDGSAWVQSKAGVEYLSKSYFRRWKRKHIKI